MKEVFLNGQFLPEAQAMVPVTDRSFLYGDGLFETLRVYGGRPFGWREHLQRLHAGARYLDIRLPFAGEALEEFASDLIRRNADPEGILRIHLSRGVGRRGYSPAGANFPTLVMTTHPAHTHDPAHPTRWNLTLSSLCLPAGDRLGAFKTANKLVQVLARAEADARHCDEALLINTDGHLVEGSSTNVFWMEEGFVCTPPLDTGALPGVTRGQILKLATRLGLKLTERRIPAGHLLASDGVFLTSSVMEVVPAVQLDGKPLPESPVTRYLHEAYQQETRATAD